MNSLLKNLPLNKQHSLIVSVIAVLSIVAYFFNHLVSDMLVYQYQLIEQGQWWRLLTAHFLHTNGFHLLLNLAALLLLWALHGQFYTLINYSGIFLLTGIICSLGLYIYSPNTQQYVGLSGVLHGIFVFGALMDIRHKDKTGYLLLLGVILKIAHEQFYGASNDVASLINATVAIDAHLWGAIGGLVVTALYIMFNSINAKRIRKHN